MVRIPVNWCSIEETAGVSRLVRLLETVATAIPTALTIDMATSSALVAADWPG